MDEEACIRFLLECMGTVPSQLAGREEAERRLIVVLKAGGEQALGEICDKAAVLAHSLGLQAEEQLLRTLIDTLLGAHDQGALQTREGQLLVAVRKMVKGCVSDCVPCGKL